MIFIATGKPILDLEVSFLIFKGNYLRLIEASQPPAQLIATEAEVNPKLVERRAIAIAGDFHNFYASLSMLVDHYRTNKNKKIYSAQLTQEYDAKVAELFHGDTVASISMKLRNELSHVGIPVIRLSSEVPKFKTLLDIHYLRTALKTNHAEATFMASLPDSISVQVLADAYFRRAEELYRWTQIRYAELNPGAAGDLHLLLEPLPK